MNTFCKFLKNGLVYNNEGTVFTVSPCCYFSKNYTIDPSTDVPDQLIKHRQEWLAEDLDKTCRLCLNLEASGINSFRQASFDQIVDDHENIDFLTVAVNKKCNLACPSCDSRSSSFWYQENVRHGVVQSDTIINLHQEDHSGELTKKFLSLLESQDLSKITYIKFGGGEPLMSNTHEQILNLLPTPENITVQYTSNFSLMPPARVFELWRKFKLIKWVASLDGAGDQFTFLRWPYLWKDLLNFSTTAKLTAPDNVMFGVEHTVNILNAFYYPEFGQWFDMNLKFNRFGDQSDLNLHKCEGILSVDHMPPTLRQLVKDRLGNDHPISTMIDQTTYSGNVRETIQYLDQLDQHRNTNWRKLFPEIQEYLDD
jgi:hypothetical protein